MESEPSTSYTSLITYPSISPDAEILPVSNPPPSVSNRLFISNIHPTVDEYTLVRFFSKYGKISKLDFLFHKAGPTKGKPRGFAFIEYANPDDGRKALTHAHGRVLRTRNLVVTQANHVPDVKPHRSQEPSMLSLIKAQRRGRDNRTKEKIAMMEAKLRQMESSDSVPSHSLPPKPTCSTSGLRGGGSHATSRQRQKRPMQLPALPIVANAKPSSVQQFHFPPTVSTGAKTEASSAGKIANSQPLPSPAVTLKPPRPTLVGVRIKKLKGKGVSKAADRSGDAAAN